MNASSGSRMGRLGSGRKGPSRPVPPDARDYEYFQLYDPEDSDIADEDDPDVRNLLVNSWSAGTGPRKILKNELLKDCLSCCCCRTPGEIHYAKTSAPSLLFIFF